MRGMLEASDILRQIAQPSSHLNPADALAGFSQETLIAAAFDNIDISVWERSPDSHHEAVLHDNLTKVPPPLTHAEADMLFSVAPLDDLAYENAHQHLLWTYELSGNSYYRSAGADNVLPKILHETQSLKVIQAVVEHDSREANQIAAAERLGQLSVHADQNGLSRIQDILEQIASHNTDDEAILACVLAQTQDRAAIVETVSRRCWGDEEPALAPLLAEPSCTPELLAAAAWNPELAEIVAQHPNATDHIRQMSAAVVENLKKPVKYDPAVQCGRYTHSKSYWARCRNMFKNGIDVDWCGRCGGAPASVQSGWEPENHNLTASYIAVADDRIEALRQAVLNATYQEATQMGSAAGSVSAYHNRTPTQIFSDRVDEIEASPHHYVNLDFMQDSFTASLRLGGYWMPSEEERAKWPDLDAVALMKLGDSNAVVAGDTHHMLINWPADLQEVDLPMTVCVPGPLVREQQTTGAACEGIYIDEHERVLCNFRSTWEPTTERLDKVATDNMDWRASAYPDVDMMLGTVSHGSIGVDHSTGEIRSPVNGVVGEIVDPIPEAWNQEFRALRWQHPKEDIKFLVEYCVPADGSTPYCAAAAQYQHPVTRQPMIRYCGERQLLANVERAATIDQTEDTKMYVDADFHYRAMGPRDKGHPTKIGIPLSKSDVTDGYAENTMPVLMQRQSGQLALGMPQMLALSKDDIEEA